MGLGRAKDLLRGAWQVHVELTCHCRNPTPLITPVPASPTGKLFQELPHPSGDFALPFARGTTGLPEQSSSQANRARHSKRGLVSQQASSCSNRGVALMKWCRYSIRADHSHWNGCFSFHSYSVWVRNFVRCILPAGAFVCSAEQHHWNPSGCKKVRYWAEETGSSQSKGYR